MSKMSEEQRALLIEFMGKHKNFVGDFYKGSNGRKRVATLWKELAKQLNDTGLPHKTVEKWQKTWRNMKFKTKGKVAARVRDCRATGGDQMENEELSIEEEEAISPPICKLRNQIKPVFRGSGFSKQSNAGASLKNGADSRSLSNYPQSRNQIVSLGASSSQTRTSAEQPNESTVDQPSSRNQQENSYIKENLAKERREISSRVNKLPQNISYIPKQTIPVVDDEMKDFVKSYGMAISKGLEALPADVAIEFSLKVLKEINEKVLEAKFEQKSYYGKENGYDWCSVSDENEYDEPDTLDSDAEMGGGQGVTSMRNEKPNKVPAVQEPSREETNTASLTVETDGIHAPVSTQAPINRSINERRKSILKRKKPSKDQPHTSTEKDRDVVRSVDDEMQNFVKSYGLTISRGLETLPGDVTIGVAINVLKELNQKVLETKFKRKRSDDNKSIHSWRSVSDENDGPDDSDTEMDDCDQEEVLPKENGNKDLFLDMPIKIEPEVM